MDRMKTRIIIAVTGRLRDAKDSDAKTELIEELSDNLYQRYCDFRSSGMSEEEAYQQAMDDLGDISELLAYLDEMSDAEGFGYDDQHSKEYLNGFIKGVENMLRETIHYTKDAVDYAKDKMHEKYPDGVHVECGYEKERGFYWESNRKEQNAKTFAQFDAVQVCGIDVHCANGNVSLEPAEGETVEVTGQSDEVEIRLNEDGTLSVRQGKTASSCVMFGLGLVRADVELKLPAKVWEAVRVNTTSGDIEVNTTLEAGEIDLHSASGDITAAHAISERMIFRTSSGDVEATDLKGGVLAESMSGDVVLGGEMTHVHASSMSGDVSVKSRLLPREMTVKSTSGDCSVRIPEGEGFTVEFKTVSGDLNSNFALVGPMGRKSGSATYLDGGDRTFRISSTSGDIMLKKF